MEIINTASPNKSHFSPIIYYILILVVVAVSVFYNLELSMLRTVLVGWGPEDFIAHTLYPENFIRDWPSGIEDQKNSIVMQFYLALARLFDIQTITTSYLVLTIHTIIFAFGIFRLSKIIARDKMEPALLALIIIIGSHSAGRNLANLGWGYQALLAAPMGWGLSIGLSFHAIASALQGRYNQAAIFIALSVYAHASLGLSGMIFCAGMLLGAPKIIGKNTLISIIFCILLLAPLLWFVLYTPAINNGSIPAREWGHLIRLFSFHAYPVSMGIFNRIANHTTLPLLIILITAPLAFRFISIEDADKKVMGGIAACLIAVAAGLVFSEYSQNYFLIRLQLPRVSHLATSIGLIYATVYLWNRAMEGFLPAALSMFSIFALLLAEPGAALLPWLLLAWGDTFAKRLGPLHLSPNNCRVLHICFGVSLVLLLILSYTSQFKKITDTLLFGGRSLSNFGPYEWITTAVLMAIISRLIYHFGSKKWALTYSFTIVIVAFFTLWQSRAIHNDKWISRHAENARYYLETQYWARENTKIDALFLTSPKGESAWRQYSRRSAFGTIREWGFTSIFYNLDQQTYNEGLHRLSLFGVVPFSISEYQAKNPPGANWSNRLNTIAAQHFEKMTIDDLSSLRDDYQIDYLVLDKMSPVPQGADNFSIVYQNQRYEIRDLFSIKSGN